MESQWGLAKAGHWRCPLCLRKTINPHCSRHRWLLIGPVSAAQRWRIREDKEQSWNEKLRRCSNVPWLQITSWHFLLRRYQYFSDSKKPAHSAIIKSRYRDGGRKGSSHTVLGHYDLTSPFNLDGLRLWEYKNCVVDIPFYVFYLCSSCITVLVKGHSLLS